MPFKFIDLGLVDFSSSWQVQKEVFTGVKNQILPSTIIFCQHYPVITLGRLAKKSNILLSELELRGRGIQLYAIERGGDVTYHGPGQLNVYPILDLNLIKKDIHFYFRSLESLILDLLADFGILGKRYPGLTGVWVGNKKIASLGIAIKNWITFHGFSLNIKSNDLVNFQFIRPCGLDIEMTAMEEILSREPQVEAIKENLRHKFVNAFCSKPQHPVLQEWGFLGCGGKAESVLSA